MLVEDLLLYLKRMHPKAKVVVNYGDRYLRATNARHFEEDADKEDFNEHGIDDDMDEPITSNACVIEME
jgi:hypothetical protein